MRKCLLLVWLLSDEFRHGYCDHSIDADDLSFLQTSRTSRHAAAEGQQYIYGKYLKDEGNAVDNSLFLYKPRGHVSSKLALVIYFHGGSFLEEMSGNDWLASGSTEIQHFVAHGFAVARVHYRAVDTSYFYENNSTEDIQMEELIHVTSSGKLWLDGFGRKMTHYSLQATYAELVTKASYDAAQAMEYLIEHANELGIDCQKIVFFAFSSGNQPATYLTWVYHQWNVGRYTPKGIIHKDAQISYPPDGMLNRSWAVIASIVGNDFLLSDLVDQSSCALLVGNPMCVDGSKFRSGLCNKAWHDLTVSRFCERPAFDSITIAELVTAQVWPTGLQTACCDFSEGLQKLWYPSMNMQPHQFGSFHLTVCNSANGTTDLHVAHSSMYAFQYAKEAQAANINYTAYYTDFRGMPAEAITEKQVVPAIKTPHTLSNIRRFFSFNNSLHWNHLSSFSWRGKQQHKALQPCSYEEVALYAVYAVTQD